MYSNHEESFSITKFLTGVIVSLLFSALLGYLYGALCAISFHAYINIAANVFLGFVLAYVTPFINYITVQHLRLNRLAVSLVLSISTWYFSLVVFVLVIIKDKPAHSITDYLFQNLDLIINPYELFTLVMELVEGGYWRIAYASLAPGTLLFIGFLEVLILIAFPLFLGRGIRMLPYSSTKKKWYKEYIVTEQFGKLNVRTQSNLQDKLYGDVINTIKSFGLGHESKYTQVSIYFLEGEQIQYLSVLEVQMDHERKKEKYPVVEHMEISTQTAQEILRTWKTKSSFIPFL